MLASKESDLRRHTAGLMGASSKLHPAFTTRINHTISKTDDERMFCIIKWAPSVLLRTFAAASWQVQATTRTTTTTTTKTKNNDDDNNNNNVWSE